MADGVYFVSDAPFARRSQRRVPSLEIGCGEGKLLRVLASLFEHVAGVGHADPFACEKARTEVPTALVENADVSVLLDVLPDRTCRLMAGT